MSIKILSAGSYWFCTTCRDTSDVFENSLEAKASADRHLREDHGDGSGDARH